MSVFIRAAGRAAAARREGIYSSVTSTTLTTAEGRRAYLPVEVQTMYDMTLSCEGSDYSAPSMK